MKRRTNARFLIYLFPMLLAGVLYPGISVAKETSKLKIGVININQVLDSYVKRKELEKQFLALKTQTEQQLRQKQSAIKNLRDEVLLMDMGSESRRKNEEIIEKKIMYLQLEEKMAEAKLANKEREFFEELYRDLCNGVESIGKKEEFDLILKREDLELRSGDILELRLKIGISTVLYCSDAINITAKVIEALNSRYSKQIDEK